MNEFKHIQTAHCENGVTVSLLRQHGLDFLTEPLAFGLGSGLFYVQIPFLKVNNAPAIAFRTLPGAIFKRTCKSLGVEVHREKFRSKLSAQQALDLALDRGLSVGCQVGVFHLNYFPKEYRFHFNAHNLIVFGKEGDDYLVSDPIMEITTKLTSAELEKVRFAQGALAPRGQLYYPSSVSTVTPEMLRKGIAKGIKRNVRDMLYIPGNIAGVRGIKYTAKKMRSWREKVGERQAALYLGQIVRMQEEIGTGGGGFRFLYAAFLEESAAILQNDKLLIASEKMTQAGDRWRDSAVQMAGIYKGRLNSQQDYLHAASILDEISAIEKETFQYLGKLKLL